MVSQLALVSFEISGGSSMTSHPDQSWIITCKDFTPQARRYAKAKGIRLATLRLFQDADWRNRIHTIVLTLTHVIVRNDKLDLKINMDDADGVRLQQDLCGFHFGIEIAQDPTQVYDGQTTRSICEIVQSLATTPIAPTAGEVEKVILADGAWISGNGTVRYPIRGLRIAAPIERIVQEYRTTADQGAARLLLTDSTGLDFVLWENTLQGYRIQQDGTVVLSDEAVQKHLMMSVSSPAG